MPEATGHEELGQRVQLLNGFAFPSSRFSRTDGTPLIRIRDLDSAEPEIRYSGSVDPRYIVEPDDILIGMDGEFKVVRWGGPRSLLNQRVCKVSITDPGLDPDFVYYSLQPNLDAIHRRTPQTTVRHLSTKDVRAIPMPTLPRNEQRRVAEILGSVDESIRFSELLIAKYVEQRIGFLVRFFRSIAEAGDVVRLSSLGMGDNGVLRIGPFGSSLKGSDWVPAGVPVITIGSLGVGRISADELLYVTPAKATALSAYRVRNGDVVFSRVADVGRSVVITEKQDGWLMSSNLLRISVDRRVVQPAFLQLTLAYSPAVRAQLRATINSSGRDVTSARTIENLQLPVPPIEKQSTICKASDAALALVAVEGARLGKLRAIKRGLMDSLLTGRVRVKVGEA
jgi:type I restriction enzyme, S subunit